MADVKISALPASTTPLAGTEVLPIVQSSTTKQVSVANLTAGRAVSASSLTLTTPLGVASGGTGLTSLGTGVAPALGNAVNGASGICVQDAGGNLGLGVTPSAWTLTALQNKGIGLWGTASSDNGIAANAYYNAGWKYIYSGYEATLYEFNGNHQWSVAPSGTAGNAISFTQAMTLTSAGELLVGTSTSGAGKIFVYDVTSTISPVARFQTGSASFSDSLVFAAAARNTTNASFNAYSYYNTGAPGYKFYVIDSGKIYSTDTAIGSISDARHKENIRDLEQGLASILALKPRRFDWKANKGTGKKDVAGFIAQEVEPIFPDLIDAWKDDEITDLKALSMGGMVPAIVKAIQELAAKVTALEAANG